MAERSHTEQSCTAIQCPEANGAKAQSCQNKVVGQPLTFRPWGACAIPTRRLRPQESLSHSNRSPPFFSGKDPAPPFNHRDACPLLDQNGPMDDHDCQGASCKCMDDTVYAPPRRRTPRPAKTPFSGTIPGTNGAGRKRDFSKDYRSDTAEQFQARLWRETEISLRDHPERWTLRTVNGTKHHQMAPLEERRHAGS